MKLRIVLFLIIFGFLFGKEANFNDSQYSYRVEGNRIILEKKNETYQIEVYRPNMIKTTYLGQQRNIQKNDSSYMVSLAPSSDVDFKINEFENKLQIQTSEVITEVTKKPFVVNFYNSNMVPLLISSKEIKINGDKKTMTFQADKDDAFYGMGQKSIPVNRRGYAFKSYNQHIGGYSKPYATMQVNIPYVYTSSGYGVFFDNSYPGYFDLAKSNPKAWSYRADGGIYTYYFIKGKNLQKLQTSYYELTGYPPLPPKWAFGLLQSKCGYKNEKEVYNVIDKFEKHDLPLDAIILDAFWFGGYGDDYPHLMGNFTWYEDHFQNPAEYMQKLEDKGIKTITINEPQINVNSDNFQYLADQGWLVNKKGQDKPYVNESYWAGSAALLDLSHPEAQDWLWSKQKANVKLGLDAFWVDLTEPDIPVKNGEYYIGSQKKVHNIYSLLFAKILWEGFQKDFPNRRILNITRAGTAGIHRFGAIHWSGDASKTFDALKLQIPMLLGASMSGMPHYSSDIGGFTNAWDTISVAWDEYEGGPGVTSPELYTRWFQFGVFSPLLRPHSGEDQSCEPFAFDEQTLEITSEYLDLRYRLIPYIYTYAYKTATTGEQLIKPMFMVFNDEKSKNYDDQYMFGDMLVAPVYKEGQRQREVYLPKLKNGLKWIDFWNNKEYSGGKKYTFSAPIDKIPVFVKGSSIIPLGKVKDYVGESPDDTLTLRIYPGKKSQFVLYEDAGENKNYEKGEFATTTIESNKAKNSINLAIHPIKGDYHKMIKNRTWQLKFYQIENLNSLKINSKKITKENYQYNKKTKMLSLDVSKPTDEMIEIKIN